jgi:hypothetical protein
MAKKSAWKVWLKRNLLTKAVDNDYIAEVSTVGQTLRNEDLAARMVAARSELRLETIMSILSTRDELVREAIAQGAAVQDGCVRIAPRVSGAWVGVSHTFDPQVHKLGVDVSPSAELRAVFETIGVEVLGEKDSGAYIGLVTDLASGKTDGAVTPDEDLMVAGDKIKIAPEGETGLGVFLVDEQGEDHPVTHKLSENMPKKLLFRVPLLDSGTYTLKVVTRYSNSSTFLKEPRVIRYEFPLHIDSPAAHP